VVTRQIVIARGGGNKLSSDIRYLTATDSSQLDVARCSPTKIQFCAAAASALRGQSRAAAVESSVISVTRNVAASSTFRVHIVESSR